MIHRYKDEDGHVFYISDEQFAEFDRRFQEMQEHPERSLTLEELKERLKNCRCSEHAHSAGETEPIGDDLKIVLNQRFEDMEKHPEETLSWEEFQERSFPPKNG